MEFVTFGDLSLSPEESRDIIEFIAQKKEMLITIKINRTANYYLL